MCLRICEQNIYKTVEHTCHKNEKGGGVPVFLPNDKKKWLLWLKVVIMVITNKLCQITVLLLLDTNRKLYENRVQPQYQF